MKIKLINSENKIVHITENTEFLNIFAVENVEIQIRKGNEMFFYSYEYSTYNIEENFMEVYLHLMDIADIDKSNQAKAEELNTIL